MTPYFVELIILIIGFDVLLETKIASPRANTLVITETHKSCVLRVSTVEVTGVMVEFYTYTTFQYGKALHAISQDDIIIYHSMKIFVKGQ